MADQWRDKPRVSVIIPTHNRAGLLLRAVRSVLAQSYPDFELLIVDDASTDQTAAVVAQVRDSRVRYFCTPQSLGAAGARNLAASHAQGEFLAFLDDDDVWFIEKLQRQMERMQQCPKDVGLVISSYIADFGSHARLIGGPGAFADMNFQNGPTKGFALIATPGWLLRRSVFEMAGGFDEEMQSWDDWELAYRLSKYSRFEHLDEPLYLQNRVDGGSMWNNRPVWASDTKVLLRKHAKDWQAYPWALARHHRLIATTLARQGEKAEVRQRLWTAVRLEPENPSNWLLLVVAWISVAALSMGLKALTEWREWLSRTPRGRWVWGRL